MNYYKATRPNGKDFWSGKINYGRALKTGEIVRHPIGNALLVDLASTYLSVSTEPANCTGLGWPCNLYRAQPVGRFYKSPDFSNKRCCSALRVIEQLPSWQAFGPNGQEVVEFINLVKKLNVDYRPPNTPARLAGHVKDLIATQAAYYAACVAIDAKNRPDIVQHVVLALIKRDRLPPEKFQTIAGPWLNALRGKS